MKHIKIFALIALFLFFATMISFAQEKPSSTITGIYQNHDNTTLKMAFVNGVNNWLRRYRPALISQEDDYILMTARYNHEMKIELFIRNGEYEITATITQDRYNLRGAAGDVAHVANGVNRAFLNNLPR